MPSFNEGGSSASKEEFDSDEKDEDEAEDEEEDEDEDEDEAEDEAEDEDEDVEEIDARRATVTLDKASG